MPPMDHENNAGGALATMPSRVLAARPVAAQADSDEQMVELWLRSFRSPHTRRAYAMDARAFLAFVAMPLGQVTVRDIQAFGAGLTDLAAATAARRLTGVKSLIALAHRLGYLPFDVGAPVQLPAVKDTLAERILTEWQIQRLLEMETNPRNAALLRLVYGAGLRISEACGLTWRDLTPPDDPAQPNVLDRKSTPLNS